MRFDDAHDPTGCDIKEIESRYIIIPLLGRARFSPDECYARPVRRERRRAVQALVGDPSHLVARISEVDIPVLDEDGGIGRE
jgi:hypothetical protein